MHKTLRQNLYLSVILILCILQVPFAFPTLGQESAITPNEGQPQAEQKMPILEGYPPSRVQAIEKEQKQLEIVQQQVGSDKFRSFISAQKTWNPGTVITVAFNGGDNQLRQQIATAVMPWSVAANITFDFGYSPQTGNYREWTTADTTYNAYIRISFNSGSQYGTYWSAIGRESITKSQYLPNEASMNFGNFASGPPQNWQATVLHEFGHALGFMHEHQSPTSTCEQEFRWDDDSGYVPLQDMYGQFIPNQGKNPGIYTVLGGPLNWWPRAQIDFNLKKFANSVDYKLSTFDKDSIMKYHFDRWMYRDIAVSTASGCYGPENLTLSAQDQKAASEIYPRNPDKIKAVIKERRKITKEILKLQSLTFDLKSQLQTDINSIKEPQ